jgi:hypothetical protein
LVTCRSLLLALALTVAAAPPARADWHITPFVGVTFAGTTNLALLEGAASEMKLTFGGTVSVIGSGIFGIEGEFGYLPRFFERDTSLPPLQQDTPPPPVTRGGVWTLMGNLVVAVPERWAGYSLRPFVSGGIGLMHASASDPAIDLFPVNSNLLGMNVGGGAIGFLSDRYGLRLEIRYFRNLSGDETADSFGSTRLSYWRGNVGVVIRVPGAQRRP